MISVESFIRIAVAVSPSGRLGDSDFAVGYKIIACIAGKGIVVRRIHINNDDGIGNGSIIVRRFEKL